MGGFTWVHNVLFGISRGTQFPAGISDYLEDGGGYLVPLVIRKGHCHITMGQLSHFHNHMYTFCTLPADTISPHSTSLLSWWNCGSDMSFGRQKR